MLLVLQLLDLLVLILEQVVLVELLLQLLLKPLTSHGQLDGEVLSGLELLDLDGLFVAAAAGL